jgi:hypothetical protein
MRARIVAVGLGIGMLLMALVGLAGAAAAQPGTYAGNTGGPSVPPPSGSSGQVFTTGSSTSGGPGEPSGLAFTGADIAGMTIVGVAAVGIGGALVYRSRQRRHSLA